MRVTAVGDCGVDRYVNLGRDRPGGITLNFAANARRLFPSNDTVGVVTALGSDRQAGLVRRAIAQLGLEACLVELEGATSIQYIEADGSLALGGERRIACPAVEVAHIVDTTGAGDSFAAGFLREYCTSRDAARSLARGAEEAASSVQRVGAFPWED